MSTTPDVGTPESVAGPGTPARTLTPVRVTVAVAAAVVVNLALAWVGSAAGASMVAAGQAVGAVPIILSTVVPFVLAALVVVLVVRRRPGFQLVAAWAGLVVAVLSVTTAFVGGADLATRLTLGAMHLVVGAAWFAAVAPRTR